MCSINEMILEGGSEFRSILVNQRENKIDEGQQLEYFLHLMKLLIKCSGGFCNVNWRSRGVAVAMWIRFRLSSLIISTIFSNRFCHPVCRVSSSPRVNPLPSMVLAIHIGACVLRKRLAQTFDRIRSTPGGECCVCLWTLPVSRCSFRKSATDTDTQTHQYRNTHN